MTASDERAPRRARIARYALWQMRDYLVDRGLPTIIVATLFGYFTVLPMLAAAHQGGPNAPGLREVNYMFLRSFLGTLVFLGALFAMNGIVANDRKLGFYRFLFAKPVAPARYYGQAFLVHWAGFMLVMTLLGTVYGMLVAPLLSTQLLLVVALMFLCYAGVAFLLSAAARWDWLSLVAVSVAATFLWNRYGASTHPLARLLYLLPPVHRADDVYAWAADSPAFASGTSHIFPWHSLAWLGGYGAACYAIGLVVLRHRRLALV